jgi:hypothetical protein
LLTRSARLLLMPGLFLCTLPLLEGQAKYTASRTGDLQLGVNFSGAQSDYRGYLKGVGFYTTFDFKPHFGVEFDLHQNNTRHNDQIYERTYELGGRYFRTYGRLSPYAKVMYGRGVFNFPQNVANLAYNLATVGGGADLKVLPYLNVRGDYEYQRWFGFPPNGLTPWMLSIGVAYHFPGTLKRGQHYGK